MATIGTLLFEIGANVARLQTDMSKARGTVESAMDGIKSAANAAKAALAAVGVGASLEGIRRFVTGAIEAQNALYELNLRTGISVETLSGLRVVARAAGMDMESMGSLVQKLEKNLFQFGETGKGKAAAAFQAIGISQKEAKAGMQNMDAFLPELARKLLSVGNEAQQSALSMMLIGKGGGDAIKFLHELAEKLELQGTTTAEAVRQAHEYEQKLAQMKTQSDKFAVSISNAVLPALIGMLEKINALNTAGGVFRNLFGGNDVMNAGARIIEIEAKLAKLRETRDELAKPTLANRINNFISPEDAAIVNAQIKLLESELAALKKVQNARVEEESRGSVHKGKRGDVTLASDEGEKAVDQLKAQHDAIMQVAKDAEAWAKAGDELEAVQQRIANLGVDVYEAYTKAAAAFRAGTLGEVENIATRIDAVTAATKNANDWARQVGLTFSSAFEDAVIHAKSYQDVLKGIAMDLARLVLRKQVTEPAGAGFTAILGKLFSGGGGSEAEQVAGPTDTSVPSYDVGTPYVPRDQLALVHKGEQIIPAGQSGGDHYYIDARGADAAGLARLEQTILALNGSFESRAEAAALRSRRNNPGAWA